MSCIVALEHDGKVYMGGDSAAASGWDIQAAARPKVFKRENILFGYTSSFRMGQLLEYNLEIPKGQYTGMYYLVIEFIPAVRACLKDGGYMRVENSQESGGTFLLGYCGKAYLVSDDFQITRMTGGFLAVGCGAAYALGALEAMKIDDPQKAVLRALEVAGKFSNGVLPPYHVVCSD